MLPQLADRTTALAAATGVVIVVLAFERSMLGDGGRRWAAIAAVVVAILVARTYPSVQRVLTPPGTAPLPLGGALAATAACVPETGAVYLPVIVLTVVIAMEVVGRQHVDVTWYWLTAALVGWVGLDGASGRPSALVGALVAWWAVLLIPLIDRLAPLRSTLAGVLVLGTGTVAVVVMARTGGVAESGTRALAIAAVVASVSLGVAVAAAAATQAFRRPQRRSS